MSNISEATVLLTSEDIMRQQQTFTALLQQLMQMTDSDDSNRITFLPHLARFMEVLRQHGDDASAVKEAMVVMKNLCRNNDLREAISPYIGDIVAFLQSHASNVEVFNGRRHFCFKKKYVKKDPKKCFYTHCTY